MTNGTQPQDWAIKYRPRSMADVILPNHLESRFRTIASNNGGISLLLKGPPGCGKTTVAMLINSEDTYFVNCNFQNRLEDIRSLERVCSNHSLIGKKRLILLDEADSLKPESIKALRAFTEIYGNVNDFVMTTNHPERMPEAISSRFLHIDFSYPETEELKLKLMKFLSKVAIDEGYEAPDPALLRSIIKRSFPDIRNMLKQLQFELLGQEVSL
jgi:putative ATPase